MKNLHANGKHERARRTAQRRCADWGKAPTLNRVEARMERHQCGRKKGAGHSRGNFSIEQLKEEEDREREKKSKTPKNLDPRRKERNPARRGINGVTRLDNLWKKDTGRRKTLRRCKDQSNSGGLRRLSASRVFLSCEGFKML